jgi:hypothetical protein
MVIYIVTMISHVFMLLGPRVLAYRHARIPPPPSFSMMR